MLDAFAKVVSQADARGEYLSAAQLDALSAMVADGNKRMDTVNRITSNASAIVANAARSLFAEQPQLIAPGGNAYTSRRMAACLRDMEIILRYVTYSRYFRRCRRQQNERRGIGNRWRSQRHHFR
jgi:phycocyanin beta chain